MDARSTLLGIYWHARDIIAPTLVYSQQIYERVLERYVTPDTVWLDLGCGYKILPDWREKEERRLVASCKRIIGIDSGLPSLQKHRSIVFRVGGDIARLPFNDDSFDLITANMVVEHLDAPAVQFAEVYRLLRPGGFFIFHTVNSYGYFSLLRRCVPSQLSKRLAKLLDGREAEDVFPVQYRANTGKKIDELARTVGFKVVKKRMIVTDAVFSVIPPIMIFELMWIRMLMTQPLKPLRTNIIAILGR